MKLPFTYRKKKEIDAARHQQQRAQADGSDNNDRADLGLYS